MTNARIIPERQQVELYISKGRSIVLKQNNAFEHEPHLVVLEPGDVPKVITWLQELLDERNTMTDAEFEEEHSTEPAA